MGFNLKDFLYVQKNDKNAIILLLVLIVVCGLTVIIGKSYLIEQNASLQNEALFEFDKFQNEMTEASSLSEDNDKDIMGNSSVKATETKSSQPTKLSAGETIDLNIASLTSLKRIPGIGEEYARRILEYRDRLGGFTSLEQLKEIKGFSGKRYSNIISYLIIKQKPKMLQINQCSKDKLLNHPYFSEKQVEAIMNVRQQNKQINTAADLLSTSSFAPRDIDRLNEYISFN